MDDNQHISQAPLVAALLVPHTFGPTVTGIQHIETHISHVFLTGIWAYKLKKPLHLEFLDYSSLERRKYFCEREVLLNRRYAPQIYDSVQPVYQGSTGISLSPPGKVCE